jgi:transposase
MDVTKQSLQQGVRPKMLELLMHEAQMMKQQGKKIYEIARALGKSERTIHNYLKEPSRPRKKRIYTSKLDPFKSYIDTILEDDPSFNREVLFRNLKKQNYQGGTTILRDYAAGRAAEITRKAVIRFETEPGYQAQVDWKILNTQMVNGRLQKLYAFTMVFGYSRAPFVIHTTSMDQATVLLCHVLAFEYFGGVPQEILYDNMKTAFIYSAVDEKWIPNKHLLSLACHYGFTPRRCRIRRPQTKGKVERFIHYYANNFWMEFKGTALNLDELNEAVLRWIALINTNTVSGLNESRQERFNHEKQYLTPLPPDSFDCRRPESVRVSTESLVRVKGNWYSVPPEFIGKTLTLRIHPLSSEAEISTGCKIIRRFFVETDKKNQRYFVASHQKALMDLWIRQSIPKKRKKNIPTADVSIRSPEQYEEMFSGQEVFV